jgi:hypothetical protein
MIVPGRDRVVDRYAVVQLTVPIGKPAEDD